MAAYLGVGCLTAVAGFAGGGMIAVLIAKVVGALQRLHAGRRDGRAVRLVDILDVRGADRRCVSAADGRDLADAARRGRRHATLGTRVIAVARIDVVMPQMGESIAEGTLSKWLKKVGDRGEARRADLRDLDRQGRRRDPGAVDRRAGRDSRDGRADGSGADGRRAARDGGERRRLARSAAAPPRRRPRRRRAAVAGDGAPARGPPPQRIYAADPPSRHPSPRPRTDTAAVTATATLSRSGSAPSRRRSCDDRRRARHRDLPALQGIGHRRSRDEEGHVEFLESGATAPPRAPVGARAVGVEPHGRCPSRGRATSSSRCRRCAR